MENETRREITPQQAMERILAIRHELQIRGNNDVEGSTIDAIISQMRAGKITPRHAVEQVHEMMQGRNDR